MRSRSATDVPPNFITSRAMTVPDAPKGVNKQSVQARKVRAPARKGAYTYRRGATTATSALQRQSSHEEPWLNDAIHRSYPAARRDGGVYDHFALGGVSTGDWTLAAGFHRLDGGWRSRSGLAIGRNGLRAVWSWSGLQRVVLTLDNGNRIRRHTVEMNMDKVESVDVDQSILGRMLNCGDITIRGTGVGIEPLHNIDAPLEFRNQVTTR